MQAVRPYYVTLWTFCILGFIFVMLYTSILVWAVVPWLIDHKIEDFYDNHHIRYFQDDDDSPAPTPTPSPTAMVTPSPTGSPVPDTCNCVATCDPTEICPDLLPPGPCMQVRCFEFLNVTLACLLEPMPIDTLCDDGNPYTTGDRCVRGGQCLGTAVPLFTNCTQEEENNCPDEYEFGCKFIQCKKINGVPKCMLGSKNNTLPCLDAYSQNEGYCMGGECLSLAPPTPPPLLVKK